MDKVLDIMLGVALVGVVWNLGALLLGLVGISVPGIDPESNRGTRLCRPLTYWPRKDLAPLPLWIATPV